MPQIRFARGLASVVIGAIVLVVPVVPAKATVSSGVHIDTGGIRIR